MKKIMCVFALSIAVSIFSPKAMSGELDGKAVLCSFPEKWGAGYWVGKVWGGSFEDGKAYTISVPLLGYPPKIVKKSFKRMDKYIVNENTIKWVTSWIDDNNSHWYIYYLDRKTLDLKSQLVSAFERGDSPSLAEPIRNSECKISSEEEIMHSLIEPLELMKRISKEKKKNNKL